jgi:pyruvate formate-lyase activating enzyme-like uncharacterized protein
MKKIFNWLNESAYTKPLSPGCKMCAKGSTLVVLITGLCPAKCFYCPLSFEKGGKDRIFADEWELDDENDIKKLISEAEYIDATGAGITGGDPLFVWRRTKKYISLLKETFGDNFHIHLYTSGLKNGEYIEDLVSAGLDEIRFHPMPKFWNKMDESPLINPIKKSLQIHVDTAIEIPAIPTMESKIFKLIKWADQLGIKWINLNELEYSERNANNFNSRNYIVKDDISASIKGSQETSYDVINMISNENFKIGVHYCSSSFKDGIQLTNRLKRRAKNIVKDYEIISEEGTLIKGVIQISKNKLKSQYESIMKTYEIPNNQIFLNQIKNRIEINLIILEKIAPELFKQGIKCYMVEEYPTADGLEVERIPLPF